MSAPTIVYVISTTTSGGSAIPTTGAPQVGDLLVLVAEGTTTNLGATQGAVNDSGGSDAGFTKDFRGTSGNGTNVNDVWSKILTSGDFGGPSGQTTSWKPANAINSGTVRWQVFVFRHANGWDTSRLLFSGQQNASVSNGTETQSLTDSSRAVAAITLWGGSSQSTTQVSWDGGTARDPYVDESVSSTTTGASGQHYGSQNALCQADFNLYDTTATPTSVAWSTGTANTSHIIVTVEYQTAPVVASLTDTAGCTATLATTSARPRGFTDTAGCTATLAISSGVGVTFTDNAHPSATLSTATTQTRGFVDTAGSTATFEGLTPGKPTAAFNDDARPTDNFTGIQHRNIAFTDTSQPAATFTTATARHVIFTDIAGSTDTLAGATGQGPITPLNGGGEWATGGTFEAQAIAFDDSSRPTATLTTGTIQSRTFTNSARPTATLSFARQHIVVQAFADSATPSASLTTASASARSFADQANPADLFTLGTTAAFTDRANCHAFLTVEVVPNLPLATFATTVAPTVRFHAEVRNTRWRSTVRDAVDR